MISAEKEFMKEYEATPQNLQKVWETGLGKLKAWEYKGSKWPDLSQNRATEPMCWEDQH